METDDEVRTKVLTEGSLVALRRTSSTPSIAGIKISFSLSCTKPVSNHFLARRSDPHTFAIKGNGEAMCIIAETPLTA